MNDIFLILFYLITPLVLLKLEQHKPSFNSVIGAYIVGIVMALIPYIKVTKKIASDFTSISIVFAITLLLLGVDLKAWLKSGKKMLIASGAFFLIVPIASIFICQIFFNNIPEIDKIAGMLTAVYTGSIPNLFVVGIALKTSEQTILTLQLADMLFSGIISFILLSPLIKKIYAILPTEKISTEYTIPEISEFNFTRAAKALLISILIIGFTVFLSKILPPESKMLIVLGGVSLLATLASLKFSFSKSTESKSLGDYALLIFCVAIGSQLKISKILDVQNLTLFLITFCVITLSCLIHMFYCYKAKIDRDIAIITMTAAIFSPAFVPAVVKSLRNPALLLSGMASALVGLAIGSYLGFIVTMAMNFL